MKKFIYASSSNDSMQKEADKLIRDINQFERFALDDPWEFFPDNDPDEFCQQLQVAIDAINEYMYKRSRKMSGTS